MSLYFNSQDGQPPVGLSRDSPSGMPFAQSVGMGWYLEISVVLGSFCISLAGLWLGLRASEHVHPPVPVELACDPDTLKRVTDERNELQSIAASIQAASIQKSNGQKVGQGIGSKTDDGVGESAGGGAYKGGKTTVRSSKSPKKYPKNNTIKYKK